MAKHRASTRPVFYRLMIPLYVTLFLLVGGFSATLLTTKQQSLKQLNHRLMQGVSRSLDLSFVRQAKMLTAIEDSLLNDPNLYVALQAQDRKHLLSLYGPIFKELLDKYSITHFYFHLPTRVNLLRVHKPEKHSDLINRFTALEAERKGGIAHGIELGPLGTFTLRVVQPVHVGDTLIGYLELGQEIEGLLQVLQKQLGVQLAVTIKKSFLERSNWEAGMKLLGRDNNWERFEKKVLIYCSLSHFPPECESCTVHDTEVLKHENPIEDVQFQNKSWKLFSHSLQDVSGAEVGDLIILYDVTDSKAAYFQLIVITAIVGCILLGGLLIIFYVILRRTDEGIQVQQTKLQESELTNRSLLEGSPVCNKIIDLDSKLLYMSIAGQNYLKIPDINSFYGQVYPPKLYPEAIRAPLVAGLQLALRGKTNRVEAPLHDMEGNEMWFDTTFVPALDDNGQVRHVIASSVDISERKRSEEKRVQLESQLQQSQKMEALGTLAGGIAHDFNNILSAILGYSEMAKDETREGSTIRADLNQVLVAGNRAKDLVAQILAFSRQAKSEQKPLQTTAIVEEAIKLLRSSIPTTITIEQQIEDDCGMIKADPTQLHQVIMNLCTNAYQAMEEQGGTLSICLGKTTLSTVDLRDEPSLSPGSYIQLTVADTGPGMDSATLKKVFDPYFTTKEVGKGTGMGLAVVHGIVKNHGGMIKYESKLGEGTSFCVFFPEEINKPEKNTLTEQPIPPGNERILFIDDEQLLADMGKQLLERLGYSVTASTSSLEALKIFKTQPDQYDLIITDQTMSGMTGDALAREIFTIRPDIPVILCTGYSSIISREKALAMGISEFVMKPMVKKDIAPLIRKVLDGEKIDQKI